MKTGQKVRLKNSFITGRFSHYEDVELTKAVIVFENGAQTVDSDRLTDPIEVKAKMILTAICKFFVSINDWRNDLENGIIADTNKTILFIFRIGIIYLIVIFTIIALNHGRL